MSLRDRLYSISKDYGKKTLNEVIRDLEGRAKQGWWNYQISTEDVSYEVVNYLETQGLRIEIKNSQSLNGYQYYNITWTKEGK